MRKGLSDKVDSSDLIILTTGEDEPKPYERKGIIADIKEIRDAFKNAGLTIVDFGIIALHVFKGISKKDK